MGCDLAASVIGGAFIGGASGMYMCLGGRVAGNSGALRSLVVGPREPHHAGFVAGLLAAGLAMAAMMPELFELTKVSPLFAAILIVGGFATGVGTTWGNGCTSGHGLCGISKLSLRSIAATPTFLVTAAITATVSTGFPWPPGLLPLVNPSPPVLTMASYLGGAFCIAFVVFAVLLRFVEKSLPLVQAALAFAVGFFFGCGLSIGGMVRPSVVIGALTLGAFDLTLWALFTTALVVTFVFYRIAQCFGVPEAFTKWEKQGAIDRKLVFGEILFGLGWGLTGFCPGPLLVGLVGRPQLGAILCVVGVGAGQLASGGIHQWVLPEGGKNAMM